ncbi:FKBP-type peptidyl-prolyl cis-trans isomerase [Sphingobacterium hungaricum]
MKNLFKLIFISISTFSFAHAQGLQNSVDSVSYALGQDIGRSLVGTGATLNAEVLLQSLNEAISGKPSLFNEEQSMTIIQTAMRKAYEEKAAKAIKVNEDFLESNKTKPNIVVTPEGLQYEVLVQGTGANPLATDEVEVHYEGKLIDGTKFDSSYDRNEPIVLTLNRVIEGWKIGIPLMKVGSKYRFYVPASLGYGERAQGEIPAFSTLIFDVELLSIKEKVDEPE